MSCFRCQGYHSKQYYQKSNPQKAWVLDQNVTVLFDYSIGMFWLKKQTIKWLPMTGPSIGSQWLVLDCGTEAFFFFLLCLKSCEILIPWPRIGSGHLVVQVLSLNHWTTRGVPRKPSCSSPQIGWEHVACFQDYSWPCSCPFWSISFSSRKKD